MANEKKIAEIPDCEPTDADYNFAYRFYPLDSQSVEYELTANQACRERHLREAYTRISSLQEQNSQLQVQISGCGVAAEGWGLSMDNGPSKQGEYGWSPAYESVIKLRYKSWRCFHCDFFTLDEKEAAAHFGDRDDAEEFKPLCKWWQRMGNDERADTLQDTIRDLNEEQNHAAALEEQVEAMRKALESLLRVHSCDDQSVDYKTEWLNAETTVCDDCRPAHAVLSSSSEVSQ